MTLINSAVGLLGALLTLVLKAEACLLFIMLIALLRDFCKERFDKGETERKNASERGREPTTRHAKTEAWSMDAETIPPEMQKSIAAMVEQAVRNELRRAGNTFVPPERSRPLSEYAERRNNHGPNPVQLNTSTLIIDKEETDATKIPAEKAGVSRAESSYLRLTLLDPNALNSYAQQVVMVEKEGGELLADRLHSGEYEAIPANIGALTENTLRHTAVTACFTFDQNIGNGKKFKATVQKKAILVKSGNAYTVRTKGTLDVVGIS